MYEVLEKNLNCVLRKIRILWGNLLGIDLFEFCKCQVVNRKIQTSRSGIKSGNSDLSIFFLDGKFIKFCKHINEFKIFYFCNFFNHYIFV